MRKLRHHHKTVELCLSNEASPRGLRGITSLHEAPPWGLHGITSWPWGTTMWPLWNYVLTLRHHRELLLGGSMELRPLDDAPPWAPTVRVIGLRPTHTLFVFHQPIIGFPCISISCQYIYKTNYPSICHTNLMPNTLISNHTNQLFHAYPHTSYIKWSTLTNHTTNTKENMKEVHKFPH